ncbi:tetratricopeptide repeat protein [Ruminiclostridium herbifermentans]|uniref:Tetratricopeptide repeat protein n=1 Tax=Ruminiclostridium herbifermentans TaxID=2488810 RepID=A0A4U7JJZ5_9FIRM|nr:tetratricopeptide repeat protein [Ruminiclostridium herbifermentans]QNU68243.1 tetratricopeptide repeat protein [Ruminiclostridium herbifermentans]
MDLKQEIKSFGPIDIEKFAPNSGKTDKVINSVELYNKAIEYLKSGNEDIAMIELKKVVSINPVFYEAINLLGLCYACTNQLDKAEELFRSIVEKENNAIKAADYLNFISISENASNKKIVKSKNKLANNTLKKQVKEPVQKNSYISNDVLAENIVLEKIGSQLKKPFTAVIFSVFSLICLIAAIILFIGTAKETRDVDAAEQNAAGQQQQVMAENNSVAELDRLKEQLEAANTKLRRYEISTQISQISALYNQKKYIEAADNLMSLNVDEFSEDLKEKYSSIKDKVLLGAANQLVTDGNTLYKNKKYAEAVKKLEKLFVLGDNWDFADKALYILGKSYVEVNDLQKAAVTYEKLIKEYPNSSYIKYAKERLKAIQ